MFLLGHQGRLNMRNTSARWNAVMQRRRSDAPAWPAVPSLNNAAAQQQGKTGLEPLQSSRPAPLTLGGFILHAAKDSRSIIPEVSASKYARTPPI